MKLLFCCKCHDLFRLHREPRQCRCGSVGGQYRPDGEHADYRERRPATAVPLGMCNHKFAGTLRGFLPEVPVWVYGEKRGHGRYHLAEAPTEVPA